MTSDEHPPTAFIQDARHEYVTLSCAYNDCGKEITLSRVDDLDGAGAEYLAQCPECGQKLRITNDTLNSLPKQLLYEAQDLLDQKRAILAVTAICQAYEVYFSWFLRKRLVYDRFAKKVPLKASDLHELNRDVEALHKAIGNWSFAKLRRAFLEVAQRNAVYGRQEYFYAIKQGYEPEEEVELIVGENARLKKFKSLNVNEDRNRCVHHTAKRLKSEQVSAHLQEAERLLLGDRELFRDWDLTEMLNRQISSEEG